MQAIKSQESYFKVEHFGIYSPNKTVTLSFPNLKKEQIEAKIIGFIKEKKYVYKPFLSSNNRIVFRDFSLVCKKEKCKADIVANDYDLSINRYKEIVYEEVVYEKPQTLIADIKAIDQKRLEAMKELEKMLS